MLCKGYFVLFYLFYFFLTLLILISKIAYCLLTMIWSFFHTHYLSRW